MRFNFTYAPFPAPKLTNLTPTSTPTLSHTSETLINITILMKDSNADGWNGNIFSVGKVTT
jgi:hypothetical protein